MKEYYDNGILKKEIIYKNTTDYVEKYYYESGALKNEKNYKNNQLDGIAKGYYEDGSLSWQLNFTNGTLDNNQLKRLIEIKHINYLVHFTNVENLENILKYGLLPKNILENKGIEFINNDKDRLDNTDAICMSIEFPNYKMFYKLRQQNSSKWAVIKLDPNIMIDLDCAFCYENAASHNIRNIPLENRKSIVAFLKMFEDVCNKSRAQLNIKNSFTTNPQAEVLVCEPVDIKNIKQICFEDKQLANQYGKMFNIECSVCDELFRSRNDYSCWQTQFDFYNIYPI